MKIVQANENNIGQLAALCYEFLSSDTTLEQEMKAAADLLNNENHHAFLAMDGDDYIGFIQVSIRHEYVDGMTTPFVGYVEGIYLRKKYQNRGLGKTLIHEGERWAVSKGCTQMGSDTGIENKNSISFHKSLGYNETYRYVSFIKNIA